MDTDKDVIERLARIEEKLSGIAEKVGKTADHETRIAVLESRSSGWKNVLLAVGSSIGAIGFGLAMLDRLYGG